MHVFGIVALYAAGSAAVGGDDEVKFDDDDDDNVQCTLSIKMHVHHNAIYVCNARIVRLNP